MVCWALHVIWGGGYMCHMRRRIHVWWVYIFRVCHGLCLCICVCVCVCVVRECAQMLRERACVSVCACIHTHTHTLTHTLTHSHKWFGRWFWTRSSTAFWTKASSQKSAYSDPCHTAHSALKSPHVEVSFAPRVGLFCPQSRSLLTLAWSAQAPAPWLPTRTYLTTPPSRQASKPSSRSKP